MLARMGAMARFSFIGGGLDAGLEGIQGPFLAAGVA